MPFTHTSSKTGKEYFLHRFVNKKEGRAPVTLYYFSQRVTSGAISELPEGYKVSEGKTGFPLLKK